MHPDRAVLLGPDRRILRLVPLVLGVLVGTGMALLRPLDRPRADPASFGLTSELHGAHVEEAVDRPCTYDTAETCHRVVFVLDEGPTPGHPALSEFQILPNTPRFTPGEGVFLSYQPDASVELRYQYSDRDRRPTLLVVAAVFTLAVIGLARLRGLGSLAGLAASVAILVSFVVPAILSGRSPELVAAVGAGAIGFLALSLARGFTPLTHVAVVGTFASLALTVGLSALTVGAAHFSGFTGEESLFLPLFSEIDVTGLLLAGIVLGALGALDDVTPTQASAVWELRRANPEMTRPALVAAGLRVGRDHIASTVNTRFLAYAGAAMPLLILLGFGGLPLSLVANSEVVAVENVRTLVGSVGLVAAVPLTTWLAAAVAAPAPELA